MFILRDEDFVRLSQLVKNNQVDNTTREVIDGVLKRLQIAGSSNAKITIDNFVDKAIDGLFSFATKLKESRK